MNRKAGGQEVHKSLSFGPGKPPEMTLVALHMHSQLFHYWPSVQRKVSWMDTKMYLIGC